MLPLLRLSSDARIVNVGSGAGSLTYNSNPVYAYRKMYSLDLQQYTGDFFRQPSERCKNRTLVAPGSGNAGLNAVVGDYTIPQCTQRWLIELRPAS